MLKKIIALILLLPLFVNAASRDFAGGSSTDNITHGSAATLDNLHQGSMSIAGWTNIDTFDATSRRILNKGSDGPTNGWYFIENNANCGGATTSYVFAVRWSGAEAQWCNGSYTGGAWKHFAVTYNGSSSTNDAVFYKNGVSVAVTKLASPSGSNNTDDSSLNLIVGNRETTKNRATDGRLAYMSVHSGILTAVEVNELMYKPCSIPAGNVLCAPEWGDTTEPDLSGHGSTGTVTGAAAFADGPPVMYGGGLPL